MSKGEIFSIGYRAPDPHAMGQSPVFAIARTLLSTSFAKKTPKILAAFSLGSFLIHAVWLIGVLLVRKATGESAPSPTAIIGSAAEIVSTFLMLQYFVSTVLMAAVVAGCIADDRQARCWIVYFSRPLSRIDYALGKLLGVFAVPAAVLVIPTSLLALIAFGISPPGSRPGLMTLFVPATCIALLSAVVLSTLLTGISAHMDKSRTAGTVFAAVIFGAPIVGGILISLGLDAGGYLDPARSLGTIADVWLEPGKSVAGQFMQTVRKLEPVRLCHCPHDDRRGWAGPSLVQTQRGH